jgi:hypothetical protein
LEKAINLKPDLFKNNLFKKSVWIGVRMGEVGNSEAISSNP